MDVEDILRASTGSETDIRHPQYFVPFPLAGTLVRAEDTACHREHNHEYCPVSTAHLLRLWEP